MAAARQHLPRSVLDTNQLPQRQRAPLWRDSATSVWDVERITDDGFYAYVDAFQAGDLMFGTVKSSGQATERARSRIASDSLDYYMLQFYVRGQRSASARGHEVLAQGGDLLVVDMTQQLQTRSTEYQSFDLVLPRRLFDPLLGDPDAFGGALFASQQPLVALLRSHLLALYQAGPDMTQDQAIAMQGPTLALAAAALNGAVSEGKSQQVRTAAWLAVRRYLEDHLPDLELSVERVARHFGFSRATLYRIMEPVHGFSAYVRLRRLYRSREELADHAQRHRSIADIAARWGFHNAAAFSAFFSRTFGLSPRDYRQMAFGRELGPTHAASELDWSRWLTAMR